MSCVHSLAWQFTDINGIPGFPKDKKARRTWAWGFLKRFSQLMYRKATNLSVVRAMAANEPNVCKWFVEYEKVLYDFQITSLVQIWSGDETGVQNVPKEEKVLCQKCKPAYQTVGADQGETSMVLTFVNGVANIIPAMLLHKGGSEYRLLGLGMCQ